MEMGNSPPCERTEGEYNCETKIMSGDIYYNVYDGKSKTKKLCFDCFAELNDLLW